MKVPFNVDLTGKTAIVTGGYPRTLQIRVGTETGEAGLKTRFACLLRNHPQSMPSAPNYAHT